MPTQPSSTPRSDPTLLNLLPAALAGIAMLAVAVFGLLAPSADTDARVAAVFPPWWSARDVMVSLAGSDTVILREGIAPTDDGRTGQHAAAQTTHNTAAAQAEDKLTLTSQ